MTISRLSQNIKPVENPWFTLHLKGSKLKIVVEIEDKS